MSTKKINLNKSANAINAKISAGKKKPLPKLKLILANPYKPKPQTLTDNELSHFKELIASEVKSSGTSSRQFARQHNIQLGLGSSLRAIGNKKASCVIISQTIKPKFIIDQIGYFTKQTNSTVPVFTVNNWDSISTELFGVKALVVVFPPNLPGKLEKWISHHSLTPTVEQETPEDQEPSKTVVSKNEDIKLNLSNMYLAKQSNGKRTFVPDVVVESKPFPTFQSKDWTGDFISFSNKDEPMEEDAVDMEEIDEEFQRKQEKALDVLKKIAKTVQKDEPERVPEPVPKKKKKNKAKPTVNDVSEEWENDSSYISLEVHKIQPNPNRKPRNKRKNKKAKKGNQAKN